MSILRAPGHLYKQHATLFGDMQVSFEIADCTTAEFQPESYDVIYSRDTLLHIYEKPALFKRYIIMHPLPSVEEATLVVRMHDLGCIAHLPSAYALTLALATGSWRCCGRVGACWSATTAARQAPSPRASRSTSRSVATICTGMASNLDVLMLFISMV